MSNPPLVPDWPAESRPIVIDEDDLPAWERPAAPSAVTPMENFHRLGPVAEPSVTARKVTPESMKGEALDHAILAGHLGLAELRMAVDWFSVTDPTTASEYEPLLNQVADFLGRLENRSRS